MKKPTKPKKRGRPMGSVRAERNAKRAARAAQVAGQVAERQARSQTKRGKVRAEFKKRLPKETPGAFEASVLGVKAGWFERVIGARVERRVYRFRGPTAFDDAVDVLLELRDDRPKWKVYVQIGDGYHAGARWVGSRLDTPQEASVWLQGVGTTYLKKGSVFEKKKKSQLWVEVVALRAVPKGARAADVLAGLAGQPEKKPKKLKKRREKP